MRKGRILAGVFVVFLLFFSIVKTSLTFADVTPSPTPTSTSASLSGANSTQSSIGDCAAQHLSVSDCVPYLQQKYDEVKGQADTLSSKISEMDSQIQLTEARIEATKEQILSLEEDIDTTQKKISTLNASLASLTRILINRMVTGYEVGSQSSMQTLLTSNNITDFFQRLSYLQVVEHHDKLLAYDTVQAKNDYSNQKQIFEDKKQQVIALQTQLQSYTDDLNSQKAQEQQLLTETQGSEANYQQLLTEAQAQLASFSNFVITQGGASLLSNQTVCDDWGCYYNQRDSQWGSVALDGTQYSIASDGCLLTSMAMVYTHYGHKNVTPLTINSISSNFASYYPAYLNKTIVADGATSSRVNADIDATLASGNPIIVGISYDGGPLPDHFVVFVSGSNGNYTMNDPFTPNGHNISFRGRYPSVRIVETDRVTF